MVLAHGGEIGTDELMRLALLSLPVLVVLVFLMLRFGKGR